jgi:hypothetical protein
MDDVRARPAAMSYGEFMERYLTRVCEENPYTAHVLAELAAVQRLRSVHRAELSGVASARPR